MAIDFLILSTLIVSVGDLAVNLLTVCCSGRCKSDCCGLHMEHSEGNLTKSNIEDAFNNAMEKEEIRRAKSSE
jgi:hypothetical protein